MEAVTARFAMEVSQCQEQIQNLEVKVTWWSDEACKLQADMDGNPLVCLIVLFPGTHGESFDMVVV